MPEKLAKAGMDVSHTAMQVQRFPVNVEYSKIWNDTISLQELGWV
jgi:hypothetical protein